MLRTLVFAFVVLAAVHADATQGTSVLRITIAVVDANQRTVPLARHALLVGDSPPTIAPRRVVTTAEGTAEIRLRPGRYTVESDQPSAWMGRAYQWAQVVEIVAGRDATLNLTAANASVGAVTSEMAATADPLPVEPSKPVPVEPSPARPFNPSSYASPSSDFDILFITPALLASAKAAQGRTGANNTASALRPVTDFGEWADYVAESPPVLFIRASPKLVESFWLKLVRGAAATQGAPLPPIKHLGPGFSHMRVLCGYREITPIHPFRIRARVSETEEADEGFYAFDPLAIGPYCGTVSLVLSSVKDPQKTETRVVKPSVIAQVWQDFAAYREK